MSNGFDPLLDLPLNSIPVTPSPPRREAQQTWEKLEFETEGDARIYLEQLLAPWFHLRPEVNAAFGSQVLRVDYVAFPKDGSDFPYPRFGIEVKRGYQNHFKHYSAALKQAIDYTQCLVDGRRLGVVFLFPGLPEEQGMVRGAHRLAGQFRVGTIRVRYGQPRFDMCGGRLWVPGDCVKRVPTQDKVAQARRVAPLRGRRF
jgi:hypothetical protein